jgi:hypothetical protein
MPAIPGAHEPGAPTFGAKRHGYVQSLIYWVRCNWLAACEGEALLLTYRVTA